MKAFIVPRSSMLDARRWRMFAFMGALVAGTLGTLAFLDDGTQRMLLLTAALGIVGVILYYTFLQRRGAKEELLIDGNLLVHTRRSILGKRVRQRKISAMVHYEMMAYDPHALESRLDAWFRRANRHPTPAEYKVMVIDSGGVVFQRRQDFKRKNAERQPTWDLKIEFHNDPQSWVWRFSGRGNGRKEMADFLEALAQA